jgi:cystathionine beta-lyase/cystathionine gamma-synthase
MPKATQCVHAGTLPDQLHGGVGSPVYTSSSFRYLDASENVYPRYFNTPNQRAVVEKLRALEGTEGGVLFGSGMAAISTTLLAFLRPGDHLVVQRDIYGGTHHLVTTDLARLGIRHTFTGNTPEEIEAAIREDTRLVYIETPSNPLLRVTDVAAVAAVARARRVLSAIDSTFASPVNQNPAALGIDLVLHSGTKYLGGHGDLCCGALLCSAAHAARVQGSAYGLGGSLNATSCALLERSLKTLALRVERQGQSALAIARHLAGHPRVARVHYPGLETHPGHEVARRQMRGFGGMLSFQLQPRADPRRFLGRLSLIAPALSLGGVDTIICAPAATSHVKLSPAERAELGIDDGLMRLSVGIEDVEDLVADLDAALG